MLRKILLQIIKNFPTIEVKYRLNLKKAVFTKIIKIILAYNNQHHKLMTAQLK